MIEFIDHTADIGVKIKAKNLKELFEMSAYAMFSIICQNLELVECKKVYYDKIKADEEIEGLYLFLEKLLVQFDKDAIIFRCFEVHFLSKNEIEFQAKGDFYNQAIHKIGTGVKSPTYHKMKIENLGEQVLATIIFDI
jgi:SHS2 domain-containing protein